MRAAKLRYIPVVEEVGIEPTAATLAGRARYLSCHPQVPAGWRLRALLGCSRC